MERELWLGSLASYQAYTSQQEQFSIALASGMTFDNQEEDTCNSFTLFGNIAVIDIAGTLTNDDSWYNSFCGNTSYNQVRNALIEAATHSDVKAILLNIDSTGGTPNGLFDVCNLIKQIDSTGLAVYSHSGGVMASAAYALGSSARKISCGEAADIGSIGVICVHKEYTDAMKQEGIKVTVLRAGEEKALSNPYEKLSDKAKENIQSQINTLYDVFVNKVADNRHVPSEYVKEHMADGREFIGQQALTAGLVDNLSTLDDLITSLQTQLDKQTAGKETTMARKNTNVLTQAQRDAMMEGAAPEAVLEIETPAEIEVEKEVELSTEIPAEETTLSKVSDDNLSSYLREELATKNQEVMQLNLKVSTLESEVAQLNSVHEPMRKLVATSISRMQVGLNAPLMDFSDLPAELLLAQHAKITEVFCKRFPVGGVAAIQAEENKPASVSPVSAARMRQNKI